MGTCGTLREMGRAMNKPKGWSGVVQASLVC